MSSGLGWLISRSGAIAPVSSRVFDAAYLVRLVQGSSTREIVVEFEESCAVVSTGYAEEVARQFLRDAEPPEHLQVDRSGAVTVIVGPREPEKASPSLRSADTTFEPRRARSHRRGAS